jgi:hypothetical protein
MFDIVCFVKTYSGEVCEYHHGEIWIPNYSESTRNQLNPCMMSCTRAVSLDDNSRAVVNHLHYCLSIEWLGVGVENMVFGYPGVETDPDISFSS